jgi:predicted transcriptional regulator
VTLNDLQRELKVLRKRVDQNEDKLEQTAEKLEDLSDVVAEDRVKNIYTFADQSERQDFQSNLSKSHCVLITGK